MLNRIAELVCSGMAPVIRAVWSKHIGDEEAKEIEINSNDVEIQPEEKWQIKWRHASGQVELAIQGTSGPTNPFFGDGISGTCVTFAIFRLEQDILQMIKSEVSAAKHADVLF